MRYNEGGEIIEIIIRDSSGAKIENHKFQVNDKRVAKNILGSIMHKYGLTANAKKDDEDIGWLGKTNW